VLVLYKSKYGSCEKYARWIAEDTGADIFDISSFDTERLCNYDVVVFGGSLYAVGIIGLSVIKRNFDRLRDKKMIVFSVGASTAHLEVIEEVKNNNFTGEMKEKVEYYHFRGAFDYKRLNFVDRILMCLLKKKLLRKQKKASLTNDEKGMLASYSTPVNWTNRKSIAPLVESIEEFIKKGQ
jgi:menaquinone-dependent protoporphyrinogen IX oxidase